MLLTKTHISADKTDSISNGEKVFTYTVVQPSPKLKGSRDRLASSPPGNHFSWAPLTTPRASPRGDLAQEASDSWHRG